MAPNNSLQSGQDPGAGDRQANPDPGFSNGSTTLNKAQVSSLLDDSDDYSYKLDKDAQVWKVYVNETDKHDTELVNSWNDSTDVILIFAALFSAISTAFIIESTKLLQSDPAEESAQSLRAISQTLASIANTSQLPGSTRPLVDDVIEFTPSRLALAVNILWYLSLSLSLATSFIAILAKDWCHSFISGRNGQPYAQARRRQQKWMMIEKWKMSELLTVLPSLVHVALVLFSIGLCIHLWEIHALVAVPVICVLAIAFAFYVASSVAATILEYFPYPTIVSRLCRTELTRWIYQQALWIITRFVPGIVTQFVSWLVAPSYLFLLLCVGIALNALGAILYLNAAFCRTVMIYPVQALFGIKDVRLFRLLAPLAAIVLGPIIVAFFPFLILAAFMIAESQGDLPTWSPHEIYRSLKHAFLIIPWHFGAPRPGWMPTQRPSTNSPRHDIVTSQILSWLIKNCEVPQSVDVALQSIASINKQFPCQPLKECNATLEILRRLASSDLYRSEKAHATLKLYSQALSTLGRSDNTWQIDDPTTTQPTTVENLETTIWDLQALVEKNLVDLITDGKFQPDSHNLEALRIGSTFAPLSLKLLKSSSDCKSPQFSSIINMLEKHLNLDKVYLHESTLFLLTNVAIVLGLILDSDCALTVRKICRRLVHKEHRSYSPQLKAVLATSVLLQRREIHKDATEIEKIAEIERRLGTLVDWQSASVENSMLYEAALLELLNYPSNSLKSPALTKDGHRPFNMEAYNKTSVHRLWVSDPSQHSNNPHIYRNERPEAETVLPYLQAFHSVYSIINPETMRPHVYVFVLESMSLPSPPAPLLMQCGQLLDVLPVPDPSRELVSSMVERRIISKLQSATKPEDPAEVQQFLSASQLWLLHVLQQTSNVNNSEDIDIMGLRRELGINDGEDGREAQERLFKLVKDTWEQSSGKIIEALGTYAYRLMEYLYQSKGLSVPPRVGTGLQGIPQTRRGLSSMLGRTLPPTVAQAPPETRPGQASENHNTRGGDGLSSSAKGKARATNDDAVLLGNVVN